jgi:hypothetical protein
VPWLTRNPIKEMTARGLPVQLGSDASGAQMVVIRILQIENRLDRPYSPFKTVTSLSADVTTRNGVCRIATFIMRRKVAFWSFNELIDPTYNDPPELVVKELAAKLDQILFDARLAGGPDDELVARTDGPIVNFRDVYELGSGNNARAIPQLAKLSARKEGDIVRAARSSLGVLHADRQFDLLIREAERTDNDWEDRAVTLKAIADLGTPRPGRTWSGQGLAS